MYDTTAKYGLGNGLVECETSKVLVESTEPGEVQNVEIVTERPKEEK